MAQGLDMGRQGGQNFIFFEHGHVAYQIDRNYE